jgi:hypothetical protein
MPVGPAGKNPIADLSYDGSVVKSETRMRPGLRIFWNRRVVSQSYDESAVIWPQNAMPIRSTTPTPYDAKSAVFTMAKKFVTIHEVINHARIFHS